MVAGLCGPLVAVAADFNFQADIDETGLWTDDALWDGVGFPNAVGDTAFFQQPVTSPAPASGSYKLSLNNQSITIASLFINNSLNNDWTTQIGNDDLADGNLIFQNTTGNNATLTEDLVPTGLLVSRLRVFSPITLNSNLDVIQNHNLTRNTATEFVGKVNSAAGITLTKKGAGNLQMAYNGALAANEGIQGNIVIEEGAIRLIGASTISKAASVTVMDTGQLQIGNDVTNLSLGGPDAVLTLNGQGKVSSPGINNEGALRFQLNNNSGLDAVFSSKVDLASDARIRVNVGGTSGSLTNIVSGAGNLISDGTGILILSGANTYSGGSTISGGGRFIINNTTGSGVGTGDVALTGGNTVLGGTGFIGTPGDPSNVTIGGSNLNPGNLDLADDANAQPSLPGTLTIFGDLTFTGAGKVNIDLTDTDSDQIVTTGTVTLGTTALLNLPTSFVPTTDHAFTLIDNQGPNPIGGEFSNFAEGALLMLGTQEYKLSYLGGTGNDLVLAPNVSILYGDYNNNGVVDSADYVLWRKGGPLMNEFDDPGVVNAQDYEEWKARFGNTLGGGASALASSAAVPEPGTTWLTVLAIVGILAVGARTRPSRNFVMAGCRRSTERS
jgi:autotransporter-associated beta strand protein